MLTEKMAVEKQQYERQLIELSGKVEVVCGALEQEKALRKQTEDKVAAVQNQLEKMEQQVCSLEKEEKEMRRQLEKSQTENVILQKDIEILKLVL